MEKSYRDQVVIARGDLCEKILAAPSVGQKTNITAMFGANKKRSLPLTPSKRFNRATMLQYRLQAKEKSYREQLVTARGELYEKILAAPSVGQMSLLPAPSKLFNRYHNQKNKRQSFKNGLRNFPTVFTSSGNRKPRSSTKARNLSAIYKCR